MHNATQSNTTITTHCTTSTELLLSGTDDSSVTRRPSFKLQQCCHYFVSNPCIILHILVVTSKWIPNWRTKVYDLSMSPLRNFFVNRILICNGSSQLSELFTPFKGLVTYLYVVILSCILFARHEPLSYRTVLPHTPRL